MSDKDSNNIIEFRQLDENKFSYDKKKLDRILFTFDRFIENKNLDKEIDTIYEFMNFNDSLEEYSRKYLRPILTSDNSLLPFILLIEILDRLNEYDVSINDYFMPMASFKMVRDYPEYYNSDINVTELLEYFNSEVDLSQYKPDIFGNILFMFSGMIPAEDINFSEFRTTFKKLINKVGEENNEELSPITHLYLGQLISVFIESSVLDGTTFEDIYDDLEKVKYYYGAHTSMIQFLVANDKLEEAYNYIIELRDYEYPTEYFGIGPDLIIAKSTAYNFFCYLSLCMDQVAFFEEVYPDFLELPFDKNKALELLVLYKKIVGNEAFNAYMDSLLETDKVNTEVKRLLKRFLKKEYLRFS